jgi:hypothetical protein
MRPIRSSVFDWMLLFAVLFTIGLGACEREARADVPQFSTGPSVSFFRFGYKLNDPADVTKGDKAGVDVLAIGAGWSVHWNPSALVSKDGRIAYMSLTGTALAQLNALPVSGGLALAVGPSFYNGLFGLQVGYKMFELAENRPMEGLFAGGAGGHRNVFVLLNVSMNLLFAKPAGAKGAPMGPPPPNYWTVR